jgi:hypothetical protein
MPRDSKTKSHKQVRISDLHKERLNATLCNSVVIYRCCAQLHEFNCPWDGTRRKGQNRRQRR